MRGQRGIGFEVVSGSPVLRSKLRRPAIPDYFVERPRLDCLLADVADRPLTLVIAPAGAGKSQFLANWASHDHLPTAWLSLDEMDDDAFSLWTGIVAALATLLGDIGAPARTLMSARAPYVDVVVALLDEIDTARADAAVLVLDDIHHVADPATAASLSVFLQHLPSWLHVVVAGRTPPAIPLDRLRGRGQLHEVRFDDLRLTRDEAREMLARLAPGLDEADLDAADAAEGWATGVQLTALAARSQAGTGDSAPASWRRQTGLLTDDYVWHEVLATGDAAVVDVLMRLAVVDRVNTALAVAITGVPDVHALLLRGESQGLFVSRLGSGDWFRIHPLVRDALLGELRRRGEHAALHARAARWLEDAGETERALEQWLLADRARDALRLLSARSSELDDGGREALIARTLAAIPRDVAGGDVGAAVEYAACSLVSAPLAVCLDTVRHAVELAERSGDDRHAPQLEALQAMAQTMTGDWGASAAHARRAIAAPGDDCHVDPAARFAWNTLARDIALTEAWDDELQDVRHATSAVSRDPRRGIALEGVRAVGHALAGRPVEAVRVAAGVTPAAQTMTILRVELVFATAVARLELGDRARALDELHAVADRPEEPRLFCPVISRLSLALAAADDGDTAQALDELARGTALVAASAGGPDLWDWVHRAGVAVAIADGDAVEAARHANATIDPFWGPVGRARFALAFGDATDAAEHLAVAAPRCPRHRVVLGLLRARAAGTLDGAVVHVTPAIAMASANGMLQTVASDGRDLGDAVERGAWRVHDEWLQRLRPLLVPSRLPQQPPTRDLPEALTDRERDVLRLLPSRLTIAEIANELYLSVNTVKFHLRVIYRKLGVNSREGAAAIARTMASATTSAGRR